MFVCPGKWHDGRGGNRKHNRLPDRLIPQAWPGIGMQPDSNQGEITRGGVLFVQSYILIFANLVNLVNLQMCEGFNSSNEIVSRASSSQKKGLLKPLLASGCMFKESSLCRSQQCHANVCWHINFLFPFLLIYWRWDSSNGCLRFLTEGSD